MTIQNAFSFLALLFFMSVGIVSTSFAQDGMFVFKGVEFKYTIGENLMKPGKYTISIKEKIITDEDAKSYKEVFNSTYLEKKDGDFLTVRIQYAEPTSYSWKPNAAEYFTSNFNLQSGEINYNSVGAKINSPQKITQVPDDLQVNSFTAGETPKKTLVEMSVKQFVMRHYKMFVMENVIDHDNIGFMWNDKNFEYYYTSMDDEKYKLIVKSVVEDDMGKITKNTVFEGILKEENRIDEEDNSYSFNFHWAKKEGFMWKSMDEEFFTVQLFLKDQKVEYRAEGTQMKKMKTTDPHEGMELDFEAFYPEEVRPEATLQFLQRYMQFLVK